MEGVWGYRLIELKHIPPAELYKWWEVVKPGLVEVQKYGRDGWLIEDVYLAIKNGASQLHIGIREKYYRGFIVTTGLPGFRGPVLHIWATYTNSKEDEIGAFWESLIEMAKGAGFKRMTFHSPRKGWERRLSKYGFEPEQVIYTKEV